MISPKIHLASSDELDHDIKQRLLERGCSDERATKLMTIYHDMITAWKTDYISADRGSHQSAANIADDIILYETL